MSERSHIERARQRVRERLERRDEECEATRRQAILDTGVIVDMIVEKYQPLRIYQWGSVLRPGAFKSYSDVDIAVEGLTDAQRFFGLLRDAQTLTRFPVDLVQIERIEAEHAEDIRRSGKVLYERG